MSVKMRLLAILGLILATAAGATVVTLLSLFAQSPLLKSSRDSAREVAQAGIPLMMAIKDVKADVIQVQQWLTDISATRGLDGLDDGFAMAEEYAGRFRTDTEAARGHARTLGLLKVLAALDEAATAFGPYYETGVLMAKAYVEAGPEGGNKRMADFDAVAEKIGEAMDALTARVDDETGTRLKGLVAITAEVSDTNDRIVHTIFLLGVIGAAIALGGSAYLFRFIRASFDAVHGDIEVISDKDFTTPLTLDPRRTDEFGDVARMLALMRGNLADMDRMEADRAAADQRAEVEKKTLMARMADDFRSAVGSVIDTVASASTEMQASAESMSRAAGATTDQASSVAAAAEQASANVETVASAAEELSASVHEIARQVTESTRVAASAVTEAETTNRKVEGLAEAVQRIGEVVNLITDIAEQTNLLALNATIEAARAGDAGKGFAVVASEVKNLANQTAKATEEIGGQIATIQTATRDAVSAIRSIGGTIDHVNEITASVAAAVEQQSAATREIARNVEEAAVRTGEVSANIAGVTEAAGETGQNAEHVLQASSQLSSQSERLKGEVDRFVGQFLN